MIVQVSTPQMELWRINGPFSNDLHMHEDDYQITVPMYGTCQFTQENRNYTLANGTGLVQHPRERHVFEIGGQSGVLIFKVRQESLQEHAREESLELALSPQFEPSTLAGRFRQWMDPLLTFDPVERLAQEETEAQVIRYLCGALSGGRLTLEREEDKTLASPATALDPYMAQALNYIHAHYTDAITIGDLASIAMHSRFHFIRTFRSAFGVTPYQYVLRLRISESKRLLAISDRSVTDIGISLGFSSGSAFYRAFVKAVGATPEQFRRDRHT
ncbi:MAG: putative transcriptional regulator [Paenibacillus sp.]|jgi:AraC-like DNA-binding protein|nr:putative transcriptional regulator [Paenibacillus sp.]